MSMTEYLKGKPVTKCPKCGDYTLYNLPKDHEIPPELKVAVDSTVKWKKLIEEAEKLCEQYSAAQAEDTVSLTSHETINIVDTDCMPQQSSDTSMYVFEDFVPNNNNNTNNSCNNNNNPNNCRCPSLFNRWRY